MTFNLVSFACQKFENKFYLVLQVPALDGSAQEWVEAIEHAGLCVAKDSSGRNKEKMAPFLHHPKYVWRGDSFIIAFPSSKIHITCGINFPQVQFFSYGI